LYNGGRLTVSNSTLSGNSSTGNGDGGGGIFNGGTLTVSNSTLSGNSTMHGSGGGIYNTGTLTLSNSTLSGNSATQGGGISNVDGTLTVTNSTLSGNSASPSGSLSVSGGGILNLRGTLTVSNTTLSGNSATGNYGSGGGIENYLFSTLTVTGSGLSGNSADGGGGIFNAGTLTVTASTLSGNSARYDGGGIYTEGSDPVTLTNVTLTANRANTTGNSAYGGGLYIPTGSPVLHNALIAGNFIGPSVHGRLDPVGGYNLIGDGTGMTGLQNGVNGNLVGSAAAPIDPSLGPLQNNGGPTLTHALLPGSPAIDAGDNTGAPMWDQRGPGFPRIIHGVIDIGAFEYRPPRQPQLDPNPVPVQGLGPPGPTTQRVFGPAEQAVELAPQESGGATVQPDQPNTPLKPARTSVALPARDAVLEAWSDPLADVLAAL
jgi:predicted outer membrane repeat protein